MPISILMAELIERRPTILEDTGPEMAGPDLAAGTAEAIADHLTLAALSCGVPVAVAALKRPDGSWQTLAYGLAADHYPPRGWRPSDLGLSDLLEAMKRPMEVHDLASLIPTSRLLYPPYALRWAIGAPVAVPDREVAAAVLLMDRWEREAGGRENRVLASLGRLVAGALVRVPVGPPAPASHLPPAIPAAPRRAEAPGGIHSALLRSSEVAALFDVSERTVINWARSGRLPNIRTVGGHLRFRRETVLARLNEQTV